MTKKPFLFIVILLAGVWARGQNVSRDSILRQAEAADSAIIRAKADTSLAWMWKGTLVDSTSKRRHFDTPIFGNYKSNIVAGAVLMPVGLCAVAGGIVYRFYGKTDVLKNTLGMSVLGGSFVAIGAGLLGSGLRQQVLKGKSESVSMNVGILESGGAGMLVVF